MLLTVIKEKIKRGSVRASEREGVSARETQLIIIFVC